MSIEVLIADDHQAMRTALRRLLENIEDIALVGEAANGQEAVEHCLHWKPDVVTMDVVMPELGGIEAVKRIVDADPSARVVMCSAMGQEKLIEQAMQAGAAGFVVKPFDASRLLEALDEAVAAGEDA